MTANMIAAGYKGNARSRSGNSNRIRIGIFEFEESGNWPAVNHNTWKDVAAGPTRIQKFKDCSSGICSNAYPTSTADTHGNMVTGFVAGSIEEGQSPSYPGTGTVAQVQRSGISPEADIYYYRLHACGDYKPAMLQAISDGVDVVNMSNGYFTGCNQLYNCGDYNYTLATAMASGVISVAATGNLGYDSGCNLLWPAYRPEVISVSSLDTQDASASYTWLSMFPTYSGAGPLPIRTSAGTVSNMSAVMLAAPGCHAAITKAGPDGFDPLNSTGCGSSFAAPIVTGAAGLLRQALASVGWNGGVMYSNDAYTLQTMTLLFGDGYDWATGGWRTAGLSQWSGAGILRMRWPSSYVLVAPWNMACVYLSVSQGQVASYNVGGDSQPEPAATFFKAAMTWPGLDLNNVADIDFALRDTCPAGGGIATIASQTDLDLRNRVRLTSSIAGKCLRLDVIGYSVPPSQSRSVRVCYYYDAGDPLTE